MAAHPNAADRFVSEYDPGHEPFPWAVRDSATGRLHRYPDPRAGVMRYPTQAEADDLAERLNHADSATPDGAR